MAVVLGQGSVAVSDGDAEALAVGLDLHRLNDVEIKVLIHLDDVIHRSSSNQSCPQRVLPCRSIESAGMSYANRFVDDPGALGAI